MSKRILLIRHAKSDWNSNQSDFERTLNARGQSAAAEMANRLSESNIVPKHLISSPAKRAITTAGYFAEIMDLPAYKIQQEESIYEASPQTLLSIINTKIDSALDFVALVGHNPGLSLLATSLCDYVFDIPTCGMVLIEFPFDDWKMVSSGTGHSKFFDYPKNTDNG